MGEKFFNSVVSDPLNKERLKKDVFIKISDNGLPYISKTTQNSIKKYISSNEDFEPSKKLWKDLLIDSICILKINDSREKVYLDVKKNTNKFFDSFENIRLTSSYGIDEISRYFDDFIEFESVLYGTDENYRDHVEHVLQVWAIGISLIDHYNFILCDGYKINKKSKFHFELKDSCVENSISKSELWAMWTIIALCHDLGYPIEKTSKINIQARKILSHFGNMNIVELNYSFDIFNTFLVEKFLNIISSKAVIEKYKKNKKTEVQTKYRDKFSKSLEEYKHGIFSSLLLFKNLTYFLETDYFISSYNLSAEDLRQFYIRKEILRAIAGHTCPKIYHITLNSLPFLLILCDELQEWNRPKFDDLKRRKSSEEPVVEIIEFKMLPDQKIHIQFKYDFQFNSQDQKYYVDCRFKTMHCLLRSAKNDFDRKVIFNWDLIFKDFTYSLCFDSNQDSFDLMKFTRISNENKSNSQTTPDVLNIYQPNG